MPTIHEIEVREERGNWIVAVVPSKEGWPDGVYGTKADALVHARARRFATGWKIRENTKSANGKTTS